MFVPVEVAVRKLAERRAALETKLKGELTLRTRKYTVEVELPQVEQALRRVHEGTYGDCVECGESIEAKRLEAIPEVLLCKTCEDDARRVVATRERKG